MIFKQSNAAQQTQQTEFPFCDWHGSSKAKKEFSPWKFHGIPFGKYLLGAHVTWPHAKILVIGVELKKTINPNH